MYQETSLSSHNNKWLSFQGPPYFTRAPENTTVKVGEDVMLPCEANGDPPPKTRWRRIGPGFPPDGKWSKKVDLSALNFSYLNFLEQCWPKETVTSTVL